MRTPQLTGVNQPHNACIFYNPTENEHMQMKSEMKKLSAQVQVLINTINKNQESIVTSITENQESLVTSITENQQAIVNSLQETNTTIHEQLFCNICFKNIVGWRYKCSKCFDYDMCSGCYDNERYDLTHPITHTQCCMIRIKCTKEYNKL